MVEQETFGTTFIKVCRGFLEEWIDSEFKLELLQLQRGK
jgi:hypothetical protein